MNRMLNLQRLLRMVITAICVIVTVAVSCNDIGYVVAMDGPNEAFPVGSDELGLEILGNSSHDLALLPANPATKRFVWGGHTIRVLSKYHVGYDLSVMTTTGGGNSERDNRLMRGESSGATIRSTDGGALGNNTWGMTTTLPVDENSGWRGFNNDDVMQILRENRGELSQSKEPDVSETDVYYGVKIDWSTPADDYSTTVRYTLSARIPDTPAVLRLSQNKYRIGDDDDNRTIELTGVRFDRVTAVGVDFNGNYRIDDNEKCTNWRRVNDQSTNEASCELPVYNSNSASADLAPGADNMGGQFNLLVQDNTKDGGRVVPSGQQIIYYYQPQIGDVEVLNSEDGAMKIKESVGVIDMVSTAYASMVLTDDGDVYLWGNTLLSDTSGVERFGQTLAPMIVADFPSLVHTDRIVNIAAYGRSYYAVSYQGYLYTWGDNSAKQLPLDTDDDWIGRPRDSRYYDTNANNRQARSVVAGDRFGVTVDEVRTDEDKNISSWGANEHGQLGRDVVSDGTWMVHTVADGSYLLADGEKFIQADAGAANVAAVTNAGRVFTWGQYNADARLGFNTDRDAIRPHDITHDDDDKNKNYLRAAYHDEGKRFNQVAVGDDFAVLLARDKDDANTRYVYTLGSDDMGQNGDGAGGQWGNWAHAITNQFGMRSVIGVSAYGQSAAAWTSDGHLYVWGDNRGGKLGAVGNKLYAPVEVLSGYSIDKAVLGGVANYARTTTGRLLAWGGNLNAVGENSVVDITDQLLHPSYFVKVTGRNLDRSDIWIDFNRNGVMDDNETPLAKYCTGEVCYLQVSTSAVEADGEFSIVATTPHGGRDVTTDGDGLVAVKHSTARRYQELKPDAELIEIDDDAAESGIAHEQQDEGKSDDSKENGLGEEDRVDGSCGCNSGDCVAEANEGCEVDEDIDGDPDQSISADTGGPNEDESEPTGSEPGSADQGDDDTTNNGDGGGDGDNSNDCDSHDDDAETNDDETCVDTGGDIEGCDVRQKTELDGNGDTCSSDSEPDNVMNNRVTGETNLLGDISSGAQVQLVDGRRKGCLNGVSRINIDNQP